MFTSAFIFMAGVYFGAALVTVVTRRWWPQEDDFDYGADADAALGLQNGETP